MLKWIHQILNPHCPHCAAERKEAFEREQALRLEQKEEIKDERICPSCETLQKQLEIANHEKERLLDKLLERPEKPIETGPPMQMTRPKTIPWNVRRQMLEAEDRKRAELLRNAPKPQPAESVEDLEKELDVVQQEREATTNV